MINLLLILIRFILSKYSNRHNYVYRPTELIAFANIERDNKILARHGINPHFTSFELKVYALDLHVRKTIIPESIAANKVKDRSARIPIPIYYIAEQLSHSPEFIQKVLNTIDDKVYIRDKLKMYPVLPKIERILVI